MKKKNKEIDTVMKELPTAAKKKKEKQKIWYTPLSPNPNPKLNEPLPSNLTSPPSFTVTTQGSWYPLHIWTI